MLTKWGHPLTLNELFGRTVSAEEREELLNIYMMKPIGNYKPGADIKALARKAYSYM